MWACDGCGEVWKARLLACPRCRARLRPFGVDEADGSHPLASLVGLRVRERTDVPADDVSPSGRPVVRAPVDEWRQWAITEGVAPDVAAGMSKVELQALGLPEAV